MSMPFFLPLSIAGAQLVVPAFPSALSFLRGPGAALHGAPADQATLGEFGADRTSVVGFKEIRHTSGRQRTFWKKVFPCARFIVNTRRNTTRQHNSQFQKFLSLSSLEAYTSDLELWQARHPEYVHKLQLESYSVGGFNQLLSSLGVSGCNFTDMAWANKRGDWRGDDTHARISGNCQISRWDTTGMDVLGPQDLNATVL
ncbi:unnamed protein product [Prorocentrum cordatum]|uniref:Uncharacterized protein n=1 Tax=Prorocentrum cordatum TaxID=2364126 RepID=A0ABN9QG76_9DINO|nr:unnamed protein product [Polarella glacialis]